MSDSARPRLSVLEKVAYGLGDTASNFYFQAFNLFLLIYYTDVFGLSPAAVGTMMISVRVLDAVLDPLVGILADRTRTRWGKFRPYILWGAIPYGILGYVMFLNPDLDPQGKLVFAYLTYGLMWVAYTFINIPYSALMGVMSASSEDRSSLSSYRFAFAFTGSLLISLLVLPLRDWLGGGDAATGYRLTMAVFAVVSVAMFLFTFAQTRERVAPPVDQQTSLREDLRCLVRNRPWLILFGCAFLTLANVGVRNGGLIYYFKYVMGEESRMTLFMTAGSIAFIVGALLAPYCMKWASRRTLMVVLTMLNALTMVAFYFIDPRQVNLLLVIHVVGSLLAGPTPAIVWSFYADTADYGEWKFGRRSTGLVFSAAVFAQKVGLAVGSGVLGWVLEASGFVPNAAQGPSALRAIVLMISLVPGALAVLSGVMILAYRLDDATVRTVERELADRKKAVT